MFLARSFNFVLLRFKRSTTLRNVTHRIRVWLKLSLLIKLTICDLSNCGDRFTSWYAVHLNLIYNSSFFMVFTQMFSCFPVFLFSLCFPLNCFFLLFVDFSYSIIRINHVLLCFQWFSFSWRSFCPNRKSKRNFNLKTVIQRDSNLHKLLNVRRSTDGF